jgi:hypothetical protein
MSRDLGELAKLMAQLRSVERQQRAIGDGSGFTNGASIAQRLEATHRHLSSEIGRIRSKYPPGEPIREQLPQATALVGL